MSNAQRAYRVRRRRRRYGLCPSEPPTAPKGSSTSEAPPTFASHSARRRAHHHSLPRFCCSCPSPRALRAAPARFIRCPGSTAPWLRSFRAAAVRRDFCQAVNRRRALRVRGPGCAARSRPRPACWCPGPFRGQPHPPRRASVASASSRSRLLPLHPHQPQPRRRTLPSAVDGAWRAGMDDWYGPIGPGWASGGEFNSGDCRSSASSAVAHSGDALSPTGARLDPADAGSSVGGGPSPQGDHSVRLVLLPADLHPTAK